VPTDEHILFFFLPPLVDRIISSHVGSKRFGIDVYAKIQRSKSRPRYEIDLRVKNCSRSNGGDDPAGRMDRLNVLAHAEIQIGRLTKDNLQSHYAWDDFEENRRQIVQHDSRNSRLLAQVVQKSRLVVVFHTVPERRPSDDDTT